MLELIRHDIVYWCEIYEIREFSFVMSFVHLVITRIHEKTGQMRLSLSYSLMVHKLLIFSCNYILPIIISARRFISGTISN